MNARSRAFVVALGFCLLPLRTFALRILAEDVPAAKFHRFDHLTRPYAPNHAWLPFVPRAEGEFSTPLVEDKGHGDVLIVFSSLDELFAAIADASIKRGEPVDLLVFNAHGMPGGLLFPKDSSERDSPGCADWREMAASSDEKNFNDVYLKSNFEDIREVWRESEVEQPNDPCVQNAENFRTLWERHRLAAHIRATFSILIDSCTVGLGKAGAHFSKSIGQSVLGPDGTLQTLLPYGLADSSMPEGVGFWEFEDKDGLKRDNLTYARNKRGRDIMKPGTLRITRKREGVLLEDDLLSQQRFMKIDGPIKDDRR